MFLPYVLGAVLLTQSNIAALQSAKLQPNSVNSIKSIIDDRPVVLWRATFATYTGPLAGTQTIATLTLPTLTPGDQFRLTISGNAFNNSAGAQPVGVFITLVQGAISQNIGPGVANLGNAGGLTPVAWRTNIEFGVNVPGADGMYVAPISIAAVLPSTVSRATLPAASIGFAGTGSTFLTDTALTGGIYAGGGIQIAGTSTSRMTSTRTQLQYSNAVPVQVQINMSGLAAATAVVIQTGTLEGL